MIELLHLSDLHSGPHSGLRADGEARSGSTAMVVDLLQSAVAKRPDRLRLPGALSLILVAALLGLACSETKNQSSPPPFSESLSPEPDAAGAPAGLDSAHWVKIYDPEKAWNGFTLALYRRDIPILMDMNGRIVHAWPEARVKSRVRLLEDGSLLAIARGRGAVEYDWDGHLRWEYHLERALPHHDVIRLANGNTMLVSRPADSRTDMLLEVDRERRVVWEWRSEEHLSPYFGEAVKRKDITHVNSVQELPPNPWFQQRDERFRPGNLLISARNLNAVFLIDKATGDVVWTFDENLDLQHEALMIGPGFDGHGKILILNNGYRKTYEYRKSTIIEIDPAIGSIVWVYRSDDFYTPTGGVEQPLPNGNVLITSDRGGRTFEITRGGEIVWQWEPPFRPTRSRRYSYDHCPQLAALARPKEKPVRPPAGYRYIDRPVYRFSRLSARRTVQIDGRKLSVLKSNHHCARLIIPATATLEVTYGLDRDRILAAGRRAYAARFALRLWPRDSESEIALFAETLEMAGATRRRRTIGLDAYADQWVKLCVETEESGSPESRATEEFAYWTNPAITTADDAGRSAVEGAPGPLTEEEERVRREHLKALGYVD